MTQHSLRRFLADDAATALLGNDIAAALRPGDVVAIKGELGAGKTTLARAVIRSLAGNQALEVPSPTFTIVQTYDARFEVAHFDLYRLSSAQEMDELGFEEALAAGVVLVEWPERAAGRLPQGAIWVELSDERRGRMATVKASAASAVRLERSFAVRAFLDASAGPGIWRAHLTGDASTRSYETLRMPDAGDRILMDAPRRTDGPPLGGGKPYSRIARLAESVVPFLGVARALRGAGFAAPDVYAADIDRGLLIIERLGEDGVLAPDGSPLAARYEAAARLLADLHAVSWNRDMPAADGLCHHLPDYDRDAMQIEISLLLDWYLPAVLRHELSADDRQRLVAAWNGVLDRLETAEKSLVLRDFHSPNLIWRQDRRGHDRLGLIDFQDAVYGPAAYDVASLAMDARVTISEELESAIVETYAAARAGQGAFDRMAFEEAYAVMAAQRNAKILGIFVRLDRRDGKPAYLRHLPRIRDYFGRALLHPVLRPVAEALEAAGLGELHGR